MAPQNNVVYYNINVVFCSPDWHSLHLFTKCLLITYHVSSTALSTKKASVNKTDQIMEFKIEWEETGNK